MEAPKDRAMRPARSPDHHRLWTGSAWVPARSPDGTWRSGDLRRPVTPPWVGRVALMAVVLGPAGVVVGGFGFLDSCLPGSWPADPGSFCYSPPWAVPAMIFGLVALAASTLGLAAAGCRYLYAAARSTKPHRT